MGVCVVPAQTQKKEVSQGGKIIKTVELPDAASGENLDSTASTFDRVFQSVSTGFVRACIGASIGMFLGFALPILYIQLTNPAIFEDGQWGMIFLDSLPLGLF